MNSFKISLEQFKAYLKNYLSYADKEYILVKIYNIEPVSISETEVDELIKEYIQKLTIDEILDHEFFFIIFDKKPIVINNELIGDMSSRLSQSELTIAIDFFNRKYH